MVQNHLDHGTLKELTKLCPKWIHPFVYLGPDLDHAEGMHPDHQVTDSVDDQSQ